MVKIKILGSKGEDKMLLVNPEAIVTVERLSDDSFEVRLIDGRILKMTEKMFEENFDEEELNEEKNINTGMFI
jgi:hypothetical protein